MTISGSDDFEFEDIYEQHKDLVYKLSLKYSGGKQDVAEDAVQHTFMIFYQEMKTDKAIQNLKSYLHTIVKNYTLNQVQKLDREVYYEVNENDENQENNREMINSQAGMTEQSAEDTWMEQDVKAYNTRMAQLIVEEVKEKNYNWYVIIKEVFYNGRNQLDVAKELKMSESTMYAHVRRIRAWAKQHKIRFETETIERSKEMPRGISLFD